MKYRKFLFLFPKKIYEINFNIVFSNMKICKDRKYDKDAEKGRKGKGRGKKRSEVKISRFPLLNI